MSTRQRTTLLTIAVAILVFGALAIGFGGSDDEGGEGGRQAEAPAAQTSTVEATGARGTATAEATATPKPKPEVPVVEAGKLRKLEVDKGDTVRFDVRSDVAEEIHVHGYDEYVDVKAGGRTPVRFKATIEGRFEVELHGTGEQVAQLDVNP